MADQNILIKFGAETDEATADVNKFNKALEGTEQQTNDVNKASQSLRAQLRGMQQDLTAMSLAGKQNTDEYKKLRNEAGLLQDAIGDARREIATAGSDTRGLDKALRATSTLVGGFTALQGAVALFGKEGENMQKTLVKINAAMALLQGLQQIQNELTQKDSILTAAATKMKNLYALAIGRGTVAMKLFRGALIATGLGALIVILGTVIANWDRLSAAITRSFPAFGKVAQFFKDFQFYMVGTAKSAVSFFRGIGDAFSKFIDRDFKGAVKEIRNIPDEMKKAFTDGFKQSKAASAAAEKELKQAGKESGKVVGKSFADEFTETVAEEVSGRGLREVLRKAISQRGDTVDRAQGNIDLEGMSDFPILGERSRRGDRAEDSTNSRKEAIEQEKEYLTYLTESLQFVSDLTSMIADARSAKIQAEIDDLNRLKDAELENAELTARQKERIEERYAKKIAALKTKQAQQQKRADITQAIINTALAITRALPNVFLAALAAATGAAQIAIIARQPLPKFKKGGAIDGRSHESGGVHIEAEGGEWIHSRAAVQHYGKDFMKDINDMRIPKSVLMPDLPAALIAGAVSHGIDHDRLGKTIGRELAKQPKVSIALDERGFTKHISEGSNRTSYANRKFNAA